MKSKLYCNAVKKWFFVITIILSCKSFSQVDTLAINKEFDKIAQQRGGINETLRIDVEGLTLGELIATIGEEHKLNFSVTDELDEVINSNFFEVVVRDVLLFLIQRYELEVEFINGIIVFKKPQEKIIEAPPETPKVIDVIYNSRNDFLSVKLSNDSLSSVAKAITDVSKKNVVLSQDIKDKVVSSYILNRPFDQVMEMIAKSNGLDFVKDENDFYHFEKEVVSKDNSKKTKRKSKRVNESITDITSGNSKALTIELNPAGYINIKAVKASTKQILSQVTERLNINFFMYDNIGDEVTTTLVANGITFDDLLVHLFRGNEFTFSKEEDFYIIGKHDTEGLLDTELIQLENRSIESVLTTIPRSAIEGLEITEFIELNGFVVNGSKNHIATFKKLISQIDVVVPVIKIEVLIVQYQKGYEVNTGFQLGIDNQERITSGIIGPTTDITANATSVNDLIDAFNGLGIVRLGKVTSDFYANLRAMENNSLVKIASTPKLVTLNGHEATSTIGETSYFFEQTNTLANVNGGGVGQNLLTSGNFQPTEANLTVNITPIVSKDEHVTLTISVERSRFLGRISPNAPPDRATQSFQSSIRVKNNEMILLGGLEELERENSGSGTPILSRIPVIRWFFSNRTKSKDKSKLHLFIKPTVIY